MAKKEEKKIKVKNDVKPKVKSSKEKSVLTTTEKKSNKTKISSTKVKGKTNPSVFTAPVESLPDLTKEYLFTLTISSNKDEFTQADANLGIRARYIDIDMDQDLSSTKLNVCIGFDEYQDMLVTRLLNTKNYINSNFTITVKLYDSTLKNYIYEIHLNDVGLAERDGFHLDKASDRHMLRNVKFVVKASDVHFPAYEVETVN